MYTFAMAHADDRERMLRDRDSLTTEIANLTTAIAKGGDIPALADALRMRDEKLKKLDGKLSIPIVLPDRDQLRAALEQRVGDWRTILRGPHVTQARMVLQHLLVLPINIVPNPNVEYRDTPGVLYGDPRQAKWVAAAKGSGLTVGLIQKLASPTGPGHSYLVLEGPLAA
jgi:hypothetical protein